MQRFFLLACVWLACLIEGSISPSVLGQSPELPQGSANLPLLSVSTNQDAEDKEDDREDNDAFPDRSDQIVENEELSELQSEIEASKRELDRIRQRSEFAARRLKLLQQAKELRLKVLRADNRLETLEDEGDEQALKNLEQEIDSAEIRLEETYVRLRLLESRAELHAFRSELEGVEFDAALKESRRLDEIRREMEAILGPMFKHFQEGRYEQGESLGEELERLEEVYGYYREILQLKVELHWAREEQEQEAIEELEEELRQIQRFRPRSIEADDEAAMPRRQKPLPRPLEVSEQAVRTASSLSYSHDIEPLLQRHCHDCHAESASGELDLVSLVSQQPWATQAENWKNVIQQISVRSMPPQDASPMPDPDRATLIAFFRHQLESFDYSTVQQPGYEMARRLTHEEYNRTLRDLLGVDLRPADRFPQDLTASSGFENSANSLFIQPILLERYLGAAEMVLSAALPDDANQPADLAVRARIIGDRDAHDVIRTFASRAFRRPLEADELHPLVRYYDQLVAVQDDPNAVSVPALRQVLQAILVSPSFLIRSEQQREAEPGSESFAVSDLELASRLSYFLWASMPDDRLFQLAFQNKLHDPKVLAEEVDRMIDDDKSDSLGTIFAAQWLGFDALTKIPRDPIDNPWATDSLVASMQRESGSFFTSLVRENHPIERLLDADYTFVNDELARHYGIPVSQSGTDDSGWRRVSLASTPRRGILGHGSVLAITSFPNRTSPVVRGNWVLSDLLGTPPPPPPPNVSEFDERIAERERLSQRQKLELHRDNPNCYACHSQIDPLGFALEQFDWFGRFRPQRRGRRIDASGKLPDGTELNGLRGLQAALLDTQRDHLVQQMTEKMMAYALGRQLEYYDVATVNQVIASVESNDRRIRSLIQAIVSTEAFQRKHPQPITRGDTDEE